MDGGQTARGWCSTKSREPAARYRSSPDSPLEGTGFEPSVPLPRKAVPSVANRRWRHERRSRLKVQVRDGDACLEWLPIAFPFAVGPQVRMRLPPADLECCEGRVRGVEELVKLGEAYLAERLGCVEPVAGVDVGIDGVQFVHRPVLSVDDLAAVAAVEQRVPPHACCVV